MKKLLLSTLSLLLLTASTYAVSLAWDANVETDIAFYKLYVGTAAGGPYTNLVVNTGNVTNYTVANTNFVFAKKYYAVLTAANTSGLESDYSNEVNFTVLNTVKPVVVKNFRILSITP